MNQISCHDIHLYCDINFHDMWHKNFYIVAALCHSHFSSVSTPPQYSCNNHIASCCNNHSELNILKKTELHPDRLRRNMLGSFSRARVPNIHVNIAGAQFLVYVADDSMVCAQKHYRCLLIIQALSSKSAYMEKQLYYSEMHLHDLLRM